MIIVVRVDSTSNSLNSARLDTYVRTNQTIVNSRLVSRGARCTKGWYRDCKFCGGAQLLLLPCSKLASYGGCEMGLSGCRCLLRVCLCIHSFIHSWRNLARTVYSQRPWHVECCLLTTDLREPSPDCSAKYPNSDSAFWRCRPCRLFLSSDPSSLPSNPNSPAETITFTYM
jgi:hypothetical protein